MKHELQSSMTTNMLLFTCDPEAFWNQVRQIIKAELNCKQVDAVVETEIGIELLKQPLYKISDLTRIFRVSKPTIYRWIEIGELKPTRIGRRVFFIEADLNKLFENKTLIKNDYQQTTSMANRKSQV